jgi:hypothetical protein
LPTKNLYSPLLSPIRSTCPAHLFRLGLMTWGFIGWGAQIMKFSLCSLLHTLVTLSFLDPICSSVQHPRTPSACVPTSHFSFYLQFVCHSYDLLFRVLFHIFISRLLCHFRNKRR